MLHHLPHARCDTSCSGTCQAVCLCECVVIRSLVPGRAWMQAMRQPASSRARVNHAALYVFNAALFA
jgi:hypothetical protein